MRRLLKPIKDVGIVGYGAYVPMFRIKNEEIGRVWGANGFPIQEKSVNNLDEDAITIGIEAARNALKSCLLYTSPSPRDRQKSRMPSSA